MLQELKRFPEAIESYDRSLMLRPGNAACLNNKGNACREMQDYSAAMASYEQAILIRPDYAEAHYHRAILLQDLQRFEEAEAAFAKTVDLKEDHPKLFGEWLASRMMICAWDGIDALVERLAFKIREGKNASTAFCVLSCGLDLELVQQCAVTYVNDLCPDRSQDFQCPLPHSDQSIRVGYFSSDFRSHAVSQLAIGMFEAHDRERFEVFGFNVSCFAADGMTSRVEQALGKLIQLGGMAVDEIVAKVRAMNLDIAIDLNGHTKGANLHIFANRVAPLQVNYLGYPGTSGAPYFDYIIGDPTIIPPEHFGQYHEKIAHLKHCYLPSDGQCHIADRAPTRTEAGLPEQGFVFCCFNNSYKISPASFRVWMRLLAAVDGSVLWLSEANPAAMVNLRKAASASGIDPARLIFAPRTKHHSEHLARHRLADLFLDTVPYNAHTTAHDALRAGLPVLTCLGTSFPGRVAASLLKAVGMPELVTKTLGDYEALALHLARNPGELASIRSRLAINRSSYPLFDTQLFTRDMESVFDRMWGRYCAKLPPNHLTCGNVS